MSNLISVVVPVYNMGELLEVCMKSLLSQDGVDLEVILVDDGSKDNSWECCQRLAQQDARVKAYHTENQGPGPARNYGLERASGRYVFFADADDKLEEHALSIMLREIRKNNSDLLVFGYLAINSKGEVRRRKTYPDFFRSGEEIRQDYSEYARFRSPLAIQGAPWNKFYDMDIIREHGITFPPLRRSEDESFIARYMCHVKQVQFIEDVLYTHYLNDLQLEWKKYPRNYSRDITGFYHVCEETILTWNPKDVKTKSIINEEYVDGIVKAMELSYSPNYSFTGLERRAWLKEQVELAKLKEQEIYDSYSIYKKALLRLFRRNAYSTALSLMRVKVAMENRGLDRMSNKYK